jgi:predicted RNA-binding protein associated with RNAse of E/G family
LSALGYDLITEEMLKEATDRIEALEAALQRIVNGGTSVLISAALDECQINPEVLEQIVKDARAVLDKDAGR